MSILTLSSPVKKIFKEIGFSPEERAAEFLIAGIKGYLKECELEILEYETKYGCSFDNFKAKIATGEISDEFSYKIEKDIMKWGDLITEKQNWLNVFRKIESIK